MQAHRLIALALTVAVAGPSLAQTFSQEAVGDVWVYDRATDPRFDPVLRVWGDGVSSYNANGYPPGENFSHGYLMFDLSGVAPDNYIVTKASLRLRMRTATFTLEAAQQNPLEARALGTGWSEATWDYFAGNPNPEPTRFGTGDLTNFSTTGDWTMSIDLLAGAGFADAFNGSVAGDGKLAIAMTSSIPVFGQGGAPYRFYSRDFGVPETAPFLHLEFEPVPEPATLGALGAALAALARRRRPAR